MVAWYEDCLLFSYNNNLFEKLHTLTLSTFEEITVNRINNNVLAVNYKWIDKIRIQDKIFSKEAMEVDFWIYHQESILCCFGNSESAISYAVGKISQKTSTNIEKIETYKIWRTKIYNNIGKSDVCFGKMTSIHINNNLSIIERGIKKIPINNLKQNVINELLNLEDVTNISFLFKKTPYNIGANSVISFPTTTNEDQNFEIINLIVKEISDLK